jgi:hypothetical protein
METINEEDYMSFVPMIEPNLDDIPFVPMVEPTIIDAYLDDWISRDQLLSILLNEPHRLSETDATMLANDNATLEDIIHQRDAARRLKAQ